MERALAAAIFVAIVAGGVPSARLAQRTSPLSPATAEPDVDALFALYQQREFAAVADAFRRVADWRAFAEDIEDRHDDWPLDWAAAFVVEATVVLLDQVGGRDAPGLARRLIERVDRRFRRHDDATSFEVHWTLTTLSMWQGVGVELPDPGSIRGIDRRNDLIERFAENAHVQFALAVSDEQRVLDWLSTAGVEVARQQSLNRKLAVDTARAAMAELAGRYAHLSGDPVIGPEATLRAGVMHLFGERYDDSLTWLARVPQGDPWLDYLSSLFVGRALTELERYDEAAAALRAAIAVRPGAQSARTILVTALFLAGHPEEAASEARRSLTAADELDPWVWYPFGAYRHLDERLISMRELLR